MTPTPSPSPDRPASVRPPARFVIPLALLAAATTVFAIFYSRLWNYLTDDVFISVRYARHLAQGAGLVYNAGDRVEGYTNLLWTLLLTPGFWLGAGVVPWIKWMNALWAVAAALLTLRLARVVAREAGPCPGESDAPWAPVRWWTALPAAVCLASSPFILSAGEGLETMMFASLLTLTAIATLEARDDEAVPVAALAVVALGLTRPDGWAYLPWVLAVARLRGRSWGWVARCAGVGFGGLVAAEAFRWFYYGDLLPNTLYAKRGGSGYLVDRGWSQMLRFFSLSGGFVALVALVPLFVPRARGIALALGSAVALRIAFHLWSGGPWMARGRFLVPVLPIELVLIAWGVMLATRRPPWRAAGLALVTALVLLPGWRSHAGLEAAAIGYGVDLRAAHQRLGADVASHTTRDAVMAMDDAGLGPLVADRVNVDMLGLNDRHIARLPGEFGSKFDSQYVLDRNPDVIVLMSRRPPPITRSDLFVVGQRQLFDDPLFQARYRFARQYTFNEDYHLLLYVRTDSKKVDDTLRAPAP